MRKSQSVFSIAFALLVCMSLAFTSCSDKSAGEGKTVRVQWEDLNAPIIHREGEEVEEEVPTLKVDTGKRMVVDCETGDTSFVRQAFNRIVKKKVKRNKPGTIIPTAAYLSAIEDSNDVTINITKFVPAPKAKKGKKKVAPVKDDDSKEEVADNDGNDSDADAATGDDTDEASSSPTDFSWIKKWAGTIAGVAGIIALFLICGGLLLALGFLLRNWLNNNRNNNPNNNAAETQERPNNIQRRTGSAARGEAREGVKKTVIKREETTTHFYENDTN